MFLHSLLKKAGCFTVSHGIIAVKTGGLLNVSNVIAGLLRQNVQTLTSVICTFQASVFPLFKSSVALKLFSQPSLSLCLCLDESTTLRLGRDGGVLSGTVILLADSTRCPPDVPTPRVCLSDVSGLREGRKKRRKAPCIPSRP